MRLLGVTWLACTGALLVGCGSSQFLEEGTPGIREDSSGVVLWDYPAHPAGGRVLLSRRPTTAIETGRTGGGDPLGRVVAAKLLDEGSVVVAFSTAADIRRYDQAGNFLWETGPPKGRTNDFSGTRWFQEVGDSILAYDRRSSVLSTVSSRGSVVKQERILPDGRGSFVNAIGRMRDGGLLVELFENPEAADGHFRPPREVAVMDGSGNLGSTLIRTLGPEIQFVADGQGYFLSRPLFGRTTHVVVEDTGFAVVDTERYEVRRFRSNGTLRQVIRRIVGREITDKARKAAIRDRLRGTSPRGKREGERVLRNRLFHVEAPATGSLMSGGDGVLWVSDFRVSIQDPEIWFGFSVDGELLGILELPPFQSQITPWGVLGEGGT